MGLYLYAVCCMLYAACSSMPSMLCSSSSFADGGYLQSCAGSSHTEVPRRNWRGGARPRANPGMPVPWPT